MINCITQAKSKAKQSYGLVSTINPILSLSLRLSLSLYSLLSLRKLDVYSASAGNCTSLQSKHSLSKANM